ncbi:E3 ubiquitin-protein ligase SINA-like 10 [Senna tora]|uniref:RING-type E3 ubiquitin transferase n=1 Tax=Senna tora TaxID=362788 RepID=A0A835C652_9FABA|nr:E3 ubiquitin-protein ligase SINA-like 10 [Senna tora]
MGLSHKAGINDKSNEGKSWNSNRISNLSVILTDPQVLECFVCFEPLRAPIFQCENGHSSCSSCCLKLNNICALCSKPTGRIRNLSIEKLLESLRISCPNAKYGCKEYLSYIRNGSSECDHQNACPYVPFSCLFSGCDYVVSYTDLCHHLTTNHKDSTLCFAYNENVSVSFNTEDENDVVVVLCERNCDDVFVVSSKVVENVGRVVYVSFVGLKSWEHRLCNYSVFAKSFDCQSSVSFIGCAKNMQHVVDVGPGALRDCVLIPFSYFGSIYGEIECLKVGTHNRTKQDTIEITRIFSSRDSWINWPSHDDLT